jgi:serine protease Do
VTPLALAGEDAVQSIASTVRRVFEESRAGVVQVESRDERGLIRGTGFYIDPMGTIFTTATLADGTEDVHIVRGGERFPAEVLAVDHRSGIALLRSEPGAVFLQPCKADETTLASPVILVGYPLDLEVSPGFGLVAGFDKKIGEHYFSTTHLRVNAPVLRGQGGAPLLNLRGEVIGIVTASVDGGATCYALPIQAAEKVRKDFHRFGEVRHGWVGVVVDNAQQKLEGSRAVVDEIDQEAPAGQAGVRPGDVILRVGQTRITCREDVLDASFFLTAGDRTEIEVLRDGQRLVLEAEAGVHPASKAPAFHAGMDLIPPVVP